MAVYIDYLRSEIGTIEVGLRQLESYRNELLGTGVTRLSNLHLTLYGLRLVFKRCYLISVESQLLPLLQVNESDSATLILESVRSNHNETKHALGKLLLAANSSAEVENSANLSWSLNHYILSSYRLLDFELNVLFPWAEELLDGLAEERMLTHARDLDKLHGFQRVRGTEILMSSLNSAVG